MHGLRRHENNGKLVAKSNDGMTFFSELDGSIFAQRDGSVFVFADHTTGAKRGDVVFLRDADGIDMPAFRLGDIA